ncbi:MAG TPA: extracellular solute-binding protein [Candidatus Limiplasma stercoravium]|nr:extracellular solute-binding protein [Candidatus Limiplasma stercoravium]
MKRFVAFALTCMLLVCMFPALAETAPSTSKLITDEPVTLTVATIDNPYTASPLTPDLPVWKYLEEITGVHIEFETYSADQYVTAMTTRLGAGVELPDIIDMPVSFSDAYQYGKDGIVIQLNDLLEEYGTYYKQTLADKPKLESLMKGLDGEIYYLSTVRDEEMASGPYGWVIRKDWLDKLGLEEPKTLDDWYAVLKAFKEKDPNGNGVADEIPMTNYSGLSQMLVWGNVWGLHLRQSGGFYPDDNGVVQYEFIDERAKEMLAWLNKLYTEGLYDMEAITNTRSQFTSRMSSDIAGAAIAWQETTTTWNGALKASGVEDAHWVLTAIPTVEGYTPLLETSGMSNGIISISKNCQNPEVAMKWLDYVMYSEECAKLMTLGLEGTTYTKENGEITMTEFITNNPDGLGPVEAVRSLGAWQYFPFRLYSKYVTLLKMNDPEHVERAAAYIPYIVDAFEEGIATEEEMDIVSRKLTDIQTYVEEMCTKFIINQASLDEWDSYVQTVKDMGIEDVLAVYRTQYERMNAE